MNAPRGLASAISWAMSSSLCSNATQRWTDGCVRRSSVAVVPGQARASHSQETAHSQRRGRAVGAGVVVACVMRQGLRTSLVSARSRLDITHETIRPRRERIT
jgi:hypothetical protein